MSDWPVTLDKIRELTSRLAVVQIIDAEVEQERRRWHQQIDTQIDALTREVNVLRVERDLYKERAEAVERRLFAAKSEQRGLHQTDLFFNEAELLAPAAATPAKIPVPAHERIKPGRKPLNPALPRQVIRYELPEAERVCPHDGNRLIEIGVEASEQLDIVPAKVQVIRHERVKYGCACCQTGVRTAPAPLKLIPKALLTESALAWVITAKYQDSLPLYRQAAILGRFGGDIARNTLAHNVVRVGEAVQPMINLLRDHLLDAKVVQGDETEVQVLKESGRAAQTKSYMWAQISDDRCAVRLFSYAPSRSAKTALSLYEDMRGVLLSDGYEAYEHVARVNDIAHLGCWAHARRYLIEAEAVVPKANRSPDHPATQMLAVISAMYAVEARWRERPVVSDESSEQAFAMRYQMRQEYSAPLIERLQVLLLAHLHGVLPQSLLGKALHYLHGQWRKLIRYVDDGRYPIDNNACENAIRPFVVGRKNWMFCDSVGGAKASANLYSLIETCLCRIRHSAVHAECRTMPKHSSSSFVVADLQLVDSA